MKQHLRTKSYRNSAALAIVAVIVLSLSIGILRAFAQDQPLGYRLIEVTETEFVYQIFAFQEERRLDLSDLEVWPNIVGTEPIGLMFWNEPDLKYRLLEKGFARLRNEANSPSIYIEAQESAKQQGLGMWYVPPVESTPVPDATDSTSSKLSPIALVLGFISLIPWKSIANLALVAVGLFGGYELVMLVIGWFKRHRVTFIMAGEPATGKSWLWARLLTPNITVQELKQIESSKRVTTKSARTLPMGRFDIVPKLVDLPGRSSSDLVDQFLDQKRFRFLQKLLIPQKRVWVLLVSTTPKNNVTRDSSESDKVDTGYIREQLGALRTAAGFLGSRNVPKPDCVILCVSKFDLFATMASSDSASDEARNKVTGFFSAHIERVKLQCEQKRIPFRFVIVSALKGWDTDQILRHVESALYGK